MKEITAIEFRKKYTDENCATRPMYRRIDNDEFEFIGFENGIKPHQLTESTRKWYEDRGKRAILQGELF